MRKRMKFSFIIITVLLVVMISLGSASAADGGLINEFVANHDSTDTHEFIEFFGDPNTDYSTLTILEIDGDSTSAGTIDGAWEVGITDANGYMYTGFLAGEIENGTITLKLVSEFTGSVGDDLDTNNDGTLDVTPWTAVVDDVAVLNGGLTDRTYAAVVLNPGFDGGVFTVGGASRIPNGTDTDTVGDWMRNDFDGEGLPGFVGTPVFGEAYNTPLAENEAVPESEEACGDTFTPIYDIQGDGDSSPIDGLEVSTEGVVTGEFQGSDRLDGFFIQDPDGDADPNTSDGIFVYDPTSTDLDVGDSVRVRGFVDEFFGQTEITDVSLLLLCDKGGSVAPTNVTLPLSAVGDYEKYEGMLIKYPQTLSATDSYNLGRYGEVDLASNGRQWIPTNGNAPVVDNELYRIRLDDGSTVSNPDPVPYLGADNTLRLGDTVTNLTGNLDYSFEYRLQPTESVSFTRVNDRPGDPEDVGGTISAATFNVYNYWTTLGGRGAETPEELERQQDKLVSAIRALNADVIGLQELEHNGDISVASLVNELNTPSGNWAFVQEPATYSSTNAIKNGIIYQTDRVSLVGDSVWDDDPAFDNARPPLAQTFNARGEIFTVISNHFKSKSCSGATGDNEDTGQGCYNGDRTRQANALLEFVEDLQDMSGDDDVVVLGDLNSYRLEDPVQALNGGLTNQVDDFVSLDDNYSYVFSGEAGTLDYIYTTDDMADRVMGVDIWQINADEPRVLDYSAPQWEDVYQSDQYRSSDHDPVLAGFCDAVGPVIDIILDPDMLWPPNHRHWEVNASVEVEDNFDPNPVLEFVSVTSNEPDNGQGDGNTTDDIIIVDDFTFKLRAERSGKGSGRIYTVTYKATDACGNVTEASEAVVVPHDMRDKNVNPRDLRGGVKS